MFICVSGTSSGEGWIGDRSLRQSGICRVRDSELGHDQEEHLPLAPGRLHSPCPCLPNAEGESLLTISETEGHG